MWVNIIGKYNFVISIFVNFGALILIQGVTYWEPSNENIIYQCLLLLPNIVKLLN